FRSVTVQVNESLPVGWLLNNSVNVTFNNVTGGNRSASAVAQTTVILPSSGQGGGSPGIGRYVPFEEEPQVQAPAPSISTMTSDALTSISVQNWVPPEISFEEGSIACGYVTSGGEVVPSRAKGDVPVPPGFELISQPVQFSCAGDSLDFTLSVPDNFEEVRVLRCKGGSCADMPREVFTEELICNGQSLHQLRRDEVISRSRGLEAARSFTSESKELSERDRRIVGGSIRLTLTGELPVPVSVQVARAPNVLRPENEALSPMGTPHEVRVSGPNIRLPALLEWSFIVPPGYDVSNFAAYAVKGTEWVYLGASYDAETELLKVVIDDVNALLGGGKTTFVLVGLADPMSWVENKPKFVRAYDGKGARDAIVLVHGFGSSATWQPFVDDFQLTGQPYQVWLFSYPASQPNEENAKALASFLELHSAEYDNVYIVAHSLGTLVTQRALDSARSDGLPVLGKVRKAVLIAGPGQGTPTVQVFRELFTRFLSERGALGMLNMHPQVYADLAEGVTVQPVSGVGYSVIAGNAGYWFTERLFGGVPNDGVVGVTSAKKVGDSYVDDHCKDFFEVSAGHIDLNDHPIGRRIAQQLITGSRAAQNPDAALPGFNQFVRVEMQDCSADDRVFVIGRRVAENAALDPTGCSCGNGVCGLGETQESCPGDCVREVVRSTGCLLVPVPMFLGVILLVLLAGALLVMKHVLNRPVPAWLWAAVLGLAVLSVLLQAYQASSCLPKFPAAYLALASVLILLGIDYVVGKMPRGPKGPLGINDELADVKKAIEELKGN
ncbi:alpha/beta hydrolase, partial [Candidatus Woesearchaeota archaeon]